MKDQKSFQRMLKIVFIIVAVQICLFSLLDLLVGAYRYAMANGMFLVSEIILAVEVSKGAKLYDDGRPSRPMIICIALSVGGMLITHTA